MELGLRLDIVVNLSRGYGDQGILEVEIEMLCFLCHPNVVQTLPTDAAGQVGVELSRVISNAANGSLSGLGAVTWTKEAGAVPQPWAGPW
jgi:hypothetical protein